MHDLSELQRDALMETFNIGVGRASRLLSQLLGCEVAISVPLIVQSTVSDTRNMVAPSMRDSDLCMVSRGMRGIDAEIVMLFQGPHDVIASLINNSIEEKNAEGRDVRENVATKIASLVTESCIDQIEDLVGRRITRLPAVFVSKLPEKFFGNERNPSDELIIVKIDIQLRKHGVTGHLLISFTEDSAAKLSEGLEKMLSDTMD